MATPETSVSDRAFLNRTVEAVIRIGMIAGLVAWCFMIARPFLVPIIWGAIIAVTVFHGYEKLKIALGGRRILAAVLVTLCMLVMLVVPSVLLGDSLVSGASKLLKSFQSGSVAMSETNTGLPVAAAVPQEPTPAPIAMPSMTSL